jgi:hypothetical protein
MRRREFAGPGVAVGGGKLKAERNSSGGGRGVEFLGRLEDRLGTEGRPSVVAGEQALVRGQAEELAADLASWERDGEAATQLTEAFETEAAQAAERLEAAEREIEKLGRELDALIGQTVRAIDRVAPPPPGRGAAAPGGTF